MKNDNPSKIEIFNKYQQFKNNNSEALKSEILDELMPDIITIAKKFSAKLPENYETSDLIHAGVIALLEQFNSISSKIQAEFFDDIHLIIEKAVLQELEFSIGPPKQEFINNQTALDLAKKNQSSKKDKIKNKKKK